MFERSIFQYVKVESAPFGFMFEHRGTGERRNPLLVALSHDVSIVYDQLCDMYLLEGKKLPWFTPIPRKHVQNLANILGVKIHNYRTP